MANFIDSIRSQLGLDPATPDLPASQVPYSPSQPQRISDEEMKSGTSEAVAPPLQPVASLAADAAEGVSEYATSSGATKALRGLSQKVQDYIMSNPDAAAKVSATAAESGTEAAAAKASALAEDAGAVNASTKVPGVRTGPGKATAKYQAKKVANPTPPASGTLDYSNWRTGAQWKP